MGQVSNRSDPAYQLFVGNLSPQLTEDELRAMFAPFGTIGSIHLPKGVSTGLPLGFAFVVMNDEQAATRAVTGLNGVEVNGRALRVRLRF
jgi:RNA recognition motif-containing protein